MKICVLDAATIGQDVSPKILSLPGDTEVFQTSNDTEVIERIKECDVAVLNKVKLNRENLKYARNLKLICVLATGFDNIDIPYCKERGIAVCNVCGYSTDSVAQLTLSMALSLCTNLSQFNSYVKSSEYTKSGVANHLTPTFHELAGKTWGVIGLGNIGKKVARIALAMGCNILAYKRTPDTEFTCCDLETICEKSDIISVHLPLSDETRGIISRGLIGKMKKTAVFINVACGAVTDEAALADAIKNGMLGGIGVDVYSAEPFPKNHPFNAIMHLDNVCLTPHMAWGAYEARVRCVEEVAENIKAFFEGKIRNRVDI